MAKHFNLLESLSYIITKINSSWWRSYLDVGVLILIAATYKVGRHLNDW